MIKMVLLAVPVIVMTAAQGIFIYSVGNGGAEQFIETWHSFSINQTAYSKFIFSTINIWWALPVVCILGLVWSLYKSLLKLSAVMILFSLASTTALYWSAYAPELLVKL
jgi:hypothetical protein